MNWALIGASTIARQYLIPAIRSFEGSEATWVVSGSESHATQFAADEGIANAATDLEQALADPSVDAVYISSTNEKHHAQALAAIASGKHVLCEKPLAMSLAEAREMIDAAKAAGVHFATNHHLRCAGSHRAIRQLIADGRIGEVLSVKISHAVSLPEHLRGWRLDNPGAGGGVVLDMTVHDTDTIRYHLGEDPVSVVAEAASSGMGQGVEDSAMAIMTMASGIQVLSHVSFGHPFGKTGVEIHGTKGAIYGKGVIAQTPAGDVTHVTADGTEEIPFPRHDLYEQVLTEFTAAVNGQPHQGATGEDGYKSLAVALAVRDAATTGQRQHLNYGEPQ